MILIYKLWFGTIVLVNSILFAEAADGVGDGSAGRGRAAGGGVDTC